MNKISSISKYFSVKLAQLNSSESPGTSKEMGKNYLSDFELTYTALLSIAYALDNSEEFVKDFGLGSREEEREIVELYKVQANIVRECARKLIPLDKKILEVGSTGIGDWGEVYPLLNETDEGNL